MNSKARRLAAKLVTSAHGTVIAYEHEGSGPALIVVDGALSTRSGKSALRSLLAAQLTVLECERRGRGDSGDTLPYVPWPIWYCTRVGVASGRVVYRPALLMGVASGV